MGKGKASENSNSHEKMQSPVDKGLRLQVYEKYQHFIYSGSPEKGSGNHFEKILANLVRNQNNLMFDFELLKAKVRDIEEKSNSSAESLT